MAKKKHNYTDMVHDSIDRLEKIKDQDAGDNDIFTHTIDSMIDMLFIKIQDDWKKRNAKPKKRPKTYSSEIVTQKGTDENE